MLLKPATCIGDQAGPDPPPVAVSYFDLNKNNMFDDAHNDGRYLSVRLFTNSNLGYDGGEISPGEGDVWSYMFETSGVGGFGAKLDMGGTILFQNNSTNHLNMVVTGRPLDSTFGPRGFGSVRATTDAVKFEMNSDDNFEINLNGEGDISLFTAEGGILMRSWWPWQVRCTDKAQFSLNDSFEISANGDWAHPILRVDSNGTYHIKAGKTWVADL